MRRRRGRLSVVLAASVAIGASLLVGLSASGPAHAEGGGPPGWSEATHHSYLVYWDQNEREGFLSAPSGHQGLLVPPYDPNGQMCLLPDGSGRFVTGYNPTLDPTNPGFLKPLMQPPVGEAVWSRNGGFTGKTIYVPGPFMLPGQIVGGDIPPDASSNTFNNNGTMTGCAVNHEGDLFASDLGTAQGQFPPPDNGRLIEWFAPSYKSFCIIAGPTAGGVGPHHVDGTGGLTQPGDLALDRNGDLLVPEAGSATDLFGGRVVRFDHTSLPRSAAECGPDGLYPPSKLRTSVFIQGSSSLLPFPQSIAHDPACNCWAVATTIGDPAIAWFDSSGAPLSTPAPIPGESIAQVGQDPNGFNPFGLAFAPDGTAYFADIHIQCSAPLTNCGPAGNAGRVMKVTFTNGEPNAPVPVVTGLNFPTSVTVCIPHWQICPRPASEGHDHHADHDNG